MKENELNLEPLQGFFFNYMIVISWISLSFWTIVTVLMTNEMMPKVNDWNTWTLILVPFNLIIFLSWTYRIMVKKESTFFPIT